MLVGAGCLIKGAERLVDGASILADVFDLPKAFVGLTLVAFGTSAPEFFVNVLAAADGHTEFVLANVAGSNLANLCIGLGICALMGGIAVRKSEFGRNLMVFTLAPLFVLVMLMITQQDALAAWSMIPLTLLLLFYAGSLTGRKGDETKDEPTDDERKEEPSEAAANGSTDAKEPTVGRGLGLFLIGGIALYAGGEFTVYAANGMADYWQIGRAIIGLTVVALLTSVPDIVASVVAARRGETGIAVGNIVGSNISNIVLVLNATVFAGYLFGGDAIAPEVVDETVAQSARLSRMDFFLVTLLSLIAWTIVVYRERLDRKAGIFLVATYVIYMIYRVSTVLM